METSFRRWVCCFLAVTGALLSLCAATVYLVDPCLYYRIPEDGQAVFFSERYQSAGLARNMAADTVILGTSMAANYRAAQAEEVFGGTAVRVTIPDGYFSELDQVVNTVFRGGTPKRVLVALDMNTLIRDESGLTGAMPEYLYNSSPLDDVKYLLNKDALYYSVYTLAARRWGEAEPVGEAFTFRNIWWNHATALKEYSRPPLAEEKLEEGAYLANVDANLAVVARWAEEHPETEFHMFLSPYSILYWDKNARLGQLDAVFAALERVCGTLTSCENIQLYGMLLERDIVENLDGYCDYIHHSDRVCQLVLQRIAAGENLLTAENYPGILANWQRFVVDYDYEKFWDENFWLNWNQTHPVNP